jgi:hypothetical protein
MFLNEIFLESETIRIARSLRFGLSFAPLINRENGFTNDHYFRA